MITKVITTYIVELQNLLVIQFETYSTTEVPKVRCRPRWMSHRQRKCQYPYPKIHNTIGIIKYNKDRNKTTKKRKRMKPGWILGEVEQRAEYAEGVFECRERSC